MIVPHSVYYNYKDNLFLSPRPLTFLYLNRALPSSFHSLSPRALFSMGCKLRWPRRRAYARARAQPPNGIMRFELVLFRRTRLIFPIGLNCTLLFPSSFFSATSFLSPFFVSPFLFSILPLTPSAPLSLFLRLSFSLIVNATGSIKSLDRHLCTPWQLPLPNTPSSLLSSFPLFFFYVRLTFPSALPPSSFSPFFPSVVFIFIFDTTLLFPSTAVALVAAHPVLYFLSCPMPHPGTAFCIREEDSSCEDDTLGMCVRGSFSKCVFTAGHRRIRN